MRVHAMMVRSEREFGRLLHNLNTIEIHLFSCMIVCLALPTKDHLGLFPFGGGLNVGCRLGRDANLTELHEAYQRKGRREDISAVIGQP